MPVLFALDFSPYDILHTFTMFTPPYREHSHIFHQRHRSTWLPSFLYQWQFVRPFIWTQECWL